MTKAANRLVKTWSYAVPDDAMLGAVTAEVTKVAGPMIAMSPAHKLLAELKKKKATNIKLHLKVDSDQLVLLAEAAAEKKKLTVKQPLIKKFGDHESRIGAVINLQPDDDVIAEASEDLLSTAGYVQRDPGSRSTLKNLDGDIMVEGHGKDSRGPEGTSQTYAVELGKHTPEQIVRVLVKAKKLPKSYAGVIYLDGCYTGAGATAPKDAPQQIQNFARQVYDLLVGLGYKKLQVRGNLGVSQTTGDGKAIARHAEEEPALEADEAQAKETKRQAEERLEKARKAEARAEKRRAEAQDALAKAQARADEIAQLMAPGGGYDQLKALRERAKGQLQRAQEVVDAWQERFAETTAALDLAREEGKDTQALEEELTRLEAVGDEVFERRDTAQRAYALASEREFSAYMTTMAVKTGMKRPKREVQAALDALKEAQDRLAGAQQAALDAKRERKEARAAYEAARKAGYMEGLTGTFGPERPTKR